MAKKFILNDNRLILGDVDFHSQLLKDHTKTVGGGLWHFDHENNRIYLYGLSTDFGHVTKKQIEQSFSYALENHSVYFSHALNLHEAITTAEQVHFITSNTHL